MLAALWLVLHWINLLNRDDRILITLMEDLNLSLLLCILQCSKFEHLYLLTDRVWYSPETSPLVSFGISHSPKP